MEFSKSATISLITVFVVVILTIIIVPVWQSFSTTSNIDRQLLRQKIGQKISVIKTKTGVFVVF